MRILIIDDHKVDRFVIRKLLYPETDVIAPASYEETIHFAMYNSFDVCLINIISGNEMEAIDLLKNLRKIQPEYFVAVAITGAINYTRYRQLLLAGFKGVMLRPFDKDNFFRIMNKKSELLITQSIDPEYILNRRLIKINPNWLLN